MRNRLNTIYTYLYKKWRIIQRILTKEPISATKIYTNITPNLHLSNSPQLEFVCSQTKIKQLNEIEATIKKSRINRF